MQLQYSRAFGAKDLKPFGMSSTPTVNSTSVDNVYLGFILASDGLWDVCDAQKAAKVATTAFLQHRDPSEALIETARDASGDNITALCVFYDTF